MADDSETRLPRPRPDQYPPRLRTPILDKELGVTPEKLRQTVEKVGVMATELHKAFGKKPRVVVEA
jgi:hypothetical protein